MSEPVTYNSLRDLRKGAKGPSKGWQGPKVGWSGARKQGDDNHIEPPSASLNGNGYNSYPSGGGDMRSSSPAGYATGPASRGSYSQNQMHTDSYADPSTTSSSMRNGQHVPPASKAGGSWLSWGAKGDADARSASPGSHAAQASPDPYANPQHRGTPGDPTTTTLSSLHQGKHPKAPTPRGAGAGGAGWKPWGSGGHEDEEHHNGMPGRPPRGRYVPPSEREPGQQGYVVKKKQTGGTHGKLARGSVEDEEEDEPDESTWAGWATKQQRQATTVIGGAAVTVREGVQTGWETVSDPQSKDKVVSGIGTGAAKVAGGAIKYTAKGVWAVGKAAFR